jgi:hypothetical protein
MEIPQLRGRAIDTTLSHVHPRSFLLPRFQSEYSFMTKYRKFSFYNFTSKSDKYLSGNFITNSITNMTNYVLIYFEGLSSVLQIA